jgi:hypothetical protein
MWSLVLLGVGCGGVEPDTGGDEAAYLDPTALYVRASLDLVGRRPTVEQLHEIEADDSALGAMIEELLESPDLPERMAWVWNDTVHTAVWATEFDRFEQFGEGWTALEARAVGFEVPSILAVLVEQGRPLTDLVTADWAPYSEDLPPLWPTVEGTDSGDGWRAGVYMDERPVAGALSTPSLWVRYNADATNYNRHRANALSRIFLCSDYFERGDQFEFSFDGTTGGVGEAIESEPSCTTCHASLDALGSFLGGFAERSKNVPTEIYLSYSELNYQWYQFQVPSAYFGYPGSTLTSLGAMVGADPRFRRCMVETFWDGLTGAAIEEPSLVAELEMSLANNDMSLRALLRAIVGSEAYGQPEQRLLNTEQISGTLSSFLRLDQAESIDTMEALFWSGEHRIMGGSTDDVTVLERDPNPSVSRALLSDLVSKIVAGAAVESEMWRSMDDRLLLPYALPMSESEVRSTFVVWFEGLASVSFGAESDEIDRLYELYLSVGGDSSAEDEVQLALGLCLRAVIQHPASAVY